MEAHRERFLEKVEKTDGCWLWNKATIRGGYGHFNYDKKMILAHRFSYYLHKECSLESIKGLVIRHSCHSPACVNPAHLSTGTQQDNMNDMVAAGRQARVSGRNNGNSKLTNEQVLAIRVAEGTFQAIAFQYGISARMVSYIKNKKYWAHLD